MKDSKNILKSLGMIGIGLCAACCLLPIGAAALGISALSMISVYSLEWGALLIVISVLLVGVYYLKKHHKPSCDIHCKEHQTQSK